MRKIKTLFTFLFACAIASAASNDNGFISIKPMMPEENGMTSEAAAQLESKMQRALTENGYADYDEVSRFIMTARINVTSKDIVPSTPPKISEKLDVTFLIGDLIENKVYSSVTIATTGVGINENKVLISAFNNIKPGDPKLKEMLAEAKAKIIDYYTNNCDELITRSNTLSSLGRYDEAIADMMSVPNVCRKCFKMCQQTAIDIYQKKVDAHGKEQLEKARNAWLKRPDADGAAEVVALLNDISPASSVYGDVEALRKEVSEKLSADEKQELEQRQREWNLLLQQYKDEQSNKQALIKACRDIGVAWGANQPNDIISNIIYGWW